MWILYFTNIFVRQTRLNSESEYMINILFHGVLVIALSISPQAKALRLIMGSKVDTSGDNQNSVR